VDGVPKRSVLRWFGTVPSLPWWMEYGAPFVVIVLLARAQPPLATLIIVGIAYVLGMQMLRVLVNDARQGGRSVSR
jgi:cytochrome c biogenesis protein CcdA